jgi:hypothetical protein
LNFSQVGEETFPGGREVRWTLDREDISVIDGVIHIKTEDADQRIYGTGIADEAALDTAIANKFVILEQSLGGGPA